MIDCELFFESDECDVFYNTALNLVQTRWKGEFVSGLPFKQILNAMLDLLQQKKLTTIIADAREMKVISAEDQQWIVSEWYPRALKAGFKNEGLVVRESSFNELSIKRIVQEYDAQLVKTRYFKTLDAALQWAKNGFE